MYASGLTASYKFCHTSLNVFRDIWGRSLSVPRFLYEHAVHMFCTVPLRVAAQCAKDIDILTSVKNVRSEGAVRGNPDHSQLPAVPEGPVTNGRTGFGNQYHCCRDALESLCFDGRGTGRNQEIRGG